MAQRNAKHEAKSNKKEGWRGDVGRAKYGHTKFYINLSVWVGVVVEQSSLVVFLLNLLFGIIK